MTSPAPWRSGARRAPLCLRLAFWLAMVAGALQAALALFMLIAGLMGGAGLEPGDSLRVVVLLPWIGLIFIGALAIALSRALAHRPLLAGCGLLLCAILPLWWGISRLLGWRTGADLLLSGFLLTGLLLVTSAACSLWPGPPGQDGAERRVESSEDKPALDGARGRSLLHRRSVRWVIALGLPLIAGAILLCVLLVLGRGDETDTFWVRPQGMALSPQPASAATRRVAGSLVWEVRPTIEGVTSLRGLGFADARHGWAVGAGTILATGDGGASWQRQSTEENTFLESVSCLDALRCWTLGESSSGHGVLLRTDDGGARWSRCSTGVVDYPSSMVFVDPQHGWMTGNGGWNVLATIDGGIHWTRQLSSSDGEGYGSLAFADVRHGWVLGNRVAENQASILHTSDGGRSWQLQREGNEPWQDWVGVTCTDAHHAWVVGNFEMLRTSDGGRTWRSCDGWWPLRVYSVSFADNRHGWAGCIDERASPNRFLILATGDGGETWAQAWSGLVIDDGVSWSNINDLEAASPTAVFAAGVDIVDASGNRGAMLVGRSATKAD